MKIYTLKYAIWIVMAFILLNLGGQMGGAESGGGEVFLPLVAGQFNLGPGDMGGVVLDSQTSTGISGVTVCVTGTSNCDLTDSDGNYLISDIPAGMTQFTAYPSSLYYPISQMKTVVAYQVETLNFVLSFSLSEGEYRVILTWNPVKSYPGCNPGEEDLCRNDLDAYLWVPDELDYFRVYWGFIGNCDGEPTYACIQQDERDGNGPETILILPVKIGVYHYSVYNYVHAVAPGVAPPLPQTEAQVAVYGESGLLYTFRVPSSGAGNWWHVFDLDGSTKQIVPVNTILEYQPFP